MLTSSGNPVSRWLRAPRLSRNRIASFVCCVALMMAACENIPDQDACIEVDATKNDQQIVTVDTTLAYDTIASTIRCIIKYRNGSPAANWPVSLYIDSARKEKLTDRQGTTESTWVDGGTYRLTVGNPAEYPCILLYNLWVPGGRNCDINISLPTNE